MMNIYTQDNVADKEMHTHLCKFKDQYSYIREIWRNNDVDPVWVPWDWAITSKRTNVNNSIIIFRPSFDTLHAVKVDEDHLIHQRNQIYGNLWYSESQKEGGLAWEKLDVFKSDGMLRRLINRFS